MIKIILIALFIILLIVLLGFKSAQIESKSPKRTGNALESKNSPENIKTLKVLRQLLLDERLLSNKINNLQVRDLLTPALDKADSILKVLQEEPSEIPNAKQFVNYYIPTLDAILKKYIKLENTDVDITYDREKIKSYLVDINKALDKEYENLFVDDKLDLSVEMEAMTLAFQRDGLITNSEYIKDEQEEKIELLI